MYCLNLVINENRETTTDQADGDWNKHTLEVSSEREEVIETNTLAERLAVVYINSEEAWNQEKCEDQALALTALPAGELFSSRNITVNDLAWELQKPSWNISVILVCYEYLLVKLEIKVVWTHQPFLTCNFNVY